jgi:hypothetical protein
MNTMHSCQASPIMRIEADEYNKRADARRQSIGSDQGVCGMSITLAQFATHRRGFYQSSNSRWHRLKRARSIQYL